MTFLFDTYVRKQNDNVKTFFSISNYEQFLQDTLESINQEVTETNMVDSG